MTTSQTHHHFKHFNKYDFVKAFVATVSISDPKIKEEKEREAVVIANAIEETQEAMFDNLATKEESRLGMLQLEENIQKSLEIIKKEMQLQKYQLIGAVATLMVFLPPFVEIVKKLLSL